MLKRGNNALGAANTAPAISTSTSAKSQKQGTDTPTMSNPTAGEEDAPEPTPSQVEQKFLRRISMHPTLTPYRRRVYRCLLSVPAGRWTTYAAMAKYLGSSPRAVGNAMRTNPFAPEVPCHRVLAADGTLGGYKGSGELVSILEMARFGMKRSYD
ncbi:Winged helix-turn-helix transcription repressor DNA-binding [Penicillium chermesinum]|nr:Winged helix-turn-helix transcription repressor DNA-binding [Penicillium chermesinum]